MPLPYPLIDSRGLQPSSNLQSHRFACLFFCVNNGPGSCQFEFYCQFSRLLKTVTEIFGVVFAKITQYPRVRTAHLGNRHEKDIVDLNFMDSCLLNSNAFKGYAILKLMWKGVTCHEPPFKPASGNISRSGQCKHSLA